MRDGVVESAAGQNDLPSSVLYVRVMHSLAGGAEVGLLSRLDGVDPVPLAAEVAVVHRPLASLVSAQQTDLVIPAAGQQVIVLVRSGGPHRDSRQGGGQSRDTVVRVGGTSRVVLVIGGPRETHCGAGGKSRSTN